MSAGCVGDLLCWQRARRLSRFHGQVTACCQQEQPQGAGIVSELPTNYPEPARMSSARSHELSAMSRMARSPPGRYAARNENKVTTSAKKPDGGARQESALVMCASYARHADARSVRRSRAPMNSSERETQPNRVWITKSDASWLLRAKSWPTGSAMQSASTRHE